MVSITYYVKLEIPTYITQPICIDIIPACSFVTCLLEVLLLWELNSSTLFHVELMNNIWLKVKRYVLKVYNNKLLEHSQYSLQFSSAAGNIFFFFPSLCCYPKNIIIVGEMLVIYSFSNRYVSLKFWSRVVQESIQRNVIPASTWSLQKSILVTQFCLY